jgi:23S rRNA (cytidine2498-2'-O)-methyltransferase
VPDFVFATCLPGFEPAVKLEVARTRPELRFAYSRPGLVTFKSPGEVAPGDPSGSVFAHVWGRSIGAAATVDEAAALLAPVGATRVHVFARDGNVQPDLAAWQTLGPGGPAELGELVADVIVAAPELGEPAWLGVHRQDASRSPHPGGDLPVVVPPESPSRAYAKLEEAIAWAHLPIEPGQLALEIGSAPGGAALALAQRGVTVWGVDTGDMAPQVLAYRHANGAHVHHVAIKVGALRWEQLPKRVDWLLVDVNLAPQVALHEIARLMPRLRQTLKGAIFTLKLNDWSFVAQLPALAARLAELGFSDVKMRHLPSNRREVCAVGMVSARSS